MPDNCEVCGKKTYSMQRLVLPSGNHPIFADICIPCFNQYSHDRPDLMRRIHESRGLHGNSEICGDTASGTT